MEDGDKYFAPALLRIASNVLSSRIFATVAREGFGDLRPSHGNVFEQLSYEDGLRLTDLALRSGMTAQSMVELVDDLQRKGYVERRPDPADRRAKRIYLTARGRANVLVGANAATAAEEFLVTAIGPERHAALRDILVQIISLGEQGEDGL